MENKPLFLGISSGGENTARRTPYLALPVLAAAVGLVVSMPALWTIAPLASGVSAVLALVFGVPALWLMRQFGLYRRSILAVAGAVVGGLVWWLLVRRQAGLLEVVLPTVIGSATGGIFGTVFVDEHRSAAAVARQAVAILVGAVALVVLTLILLSR